MGFFKKPEKWLKKQRDKVKEWLFGATPLPDVTLSFISHMESIVRNRQQEFLYKKRQEADPYTFFAGGKAYNDSFAGGEKFNYDFPRDPLKEALHIQDREVELISLDNLTFQERLNDEK